MIDAGLVEETRSLVADYSFELKALQTLGVPGGLSLSAGGD